MRLYIKVRKLFSDMGLSGVVGCGLLVFCGAFYLSAIAPERARLDELVRDAEVSQQSRQGWKQVDASQGSAEEQLAKFYQFFSKGGALPNRLEKLYGAARHQGVELSQAEYRVVSTRLANFQRYQMTFPVHTSYVQIRRFLAEALAQDPALILDGVQFERQKVGDADVNAKIIFSILLEKPA